MGIFELVGSYKCRNEFSSKVLVAASEWVLSIPSVLEELNYAKSVVGPRFKGLQMNLSQKL